MSSPTQLPAWQALAQHRQEMSDVHMSELFADDAQRSATFQASAAGWSLDYSKNRATQQTMSLLLQLVEQAGMSDAITGMFDGEHINNTEDRSVLHVALRASKAQQTLMVDGTNVLDEVRSTLAQMDTFVEQLHSGVWRGYSDKAITDVVSIGIGGSYLGPKVVTTKTCCFKPLLSLFAYSGVTHATF